MIVMSKSVGARDDSQRGATLVEFALALPIMMLILFGILDFSSAVRYSNSLSHAAREGARLASVQNYSGGGWGAVGNAPGIYSGSASVPNNSVVARVVTHSNVPNPALLSIQIGTNGLGSTQPYMNMPVTVQVTYPYTPTTTLIVGGASINLSSRATMLIE